ncbi:Tyrosinase [Ascochyta rabiei]|uniref:tyrosinase n=1 Tax=Didymella rabiei TaxID=5454 RepID=A0A163EMQ2_DIDRA|nr:Tyrosinase [Ascochyta rabiei]KZM23784.1 metal ion binding [Ascochyta rabiei]UPX19544.1 Tyrosinase [Ascochyta rabiei]
MAYFSKPQSLTTMLFALFAFLHFTVALQHGSHHHRARHSADAVIKRQMDEIADSLVARQSSGFTAVTGVCNTNTGSDGACNSNGRVSAPRLEIRQLKQNADQWNLYLLGMERFQAKDKNDRLSYYQVVGVHGRPFTTWNNFPTPLLNQAGFCPHAQTLFGSWHRPYLALFEQAWYQNVQEVIKTFPAGQQSRWNQAAATLRMPYWDWAQDPGAGGATVPTLIRDQTVTVTKPSGTVSIPNPLYSYSWGNTLPTEMGGGPWNNFPSTLRRPVASPTRSNNNEMNARFNSMRVSLRDRVFALFSSKQAWGAASTSQIGVRTDLSGSGVDSFESVHDAVHNTAGGETGGHMYYLDISSFDPIFWLHHTNIDRLLAMYQLIVPNTYVANGNINHPMAQWQQGEAKNSYTPLKPFTKNTKGDYFTSQDVKETRVLGYYYPETSDRSYSQVARAVTSLYGAGSRTLTKRDNETTAETGQYLGRPLKEGDYHHVLSVVANKYAMEGSYTVHCFIGKPGSNSTSHSTAPYSNATAPYPVSNSTAPYINGTDSEADYDPSTDYTQDPNYVGAYGVLGGSMAGGGNATYPVMTEGALPLTSCLQGKEAEGSLKSLHPDDVEPYLAENLYYKVVGVKGELNPDDIPDFHVYAKCTKVTPAASDDELPDLSAPYQKLPKATENKPAGKPFTYTPTPFDIPLPEGDEYNEPTVGNSGSTSPSYPGAGVFPYPTLPWEEQGYCVSKQTIEYVDQDGNFLYSEM